MAINLISRESDKEKLLTEKFSSQLSFGNAPNEILMLGRMENVVFVNARFPCIFSFLGNVGCISAWLILF